MGEDLSILDRSHNKKDFPSMIIPKLVRVSQAKPRYSPVRLSVEKLT